MWNIPFTLFGSAIFLIGCGMNVVSSKIPEWFGWTLIALGSISFFIGIFKHKWKNKAQIQRASSPEISIIIEHNGHYVESKNHNVYNVMKTVSIGVRNIGNTSLTNCKVYFETHNHTTNAPEQWLREDSFSLNQGEERYISLAAYSEPLPPHPKSDDWIRLSYPPSGTFWRAPNLPGTGGAVTIKAVSAESLPCEVICKLWVENSKLQWEKI